LGGEEFCTVFGEEHVVFEAEAELAAEVDAGFVREEHAGDELLGVAADEVGPLVHVETDAVAEAMDKEVVAGAVAGVGDDLAGGGVDGLHFYAGTGGGEGGGLGVLDDAEDFTLEVGGGTVDEAAGDVGGVAFDGAAVVDEDHVAFADGLDFVRAVGDGGVGADVAGGVAGDATAGVGAVYEVGEVLVGVSGAAGLVDGTVDVEGDAVGEAEEGDFGGGLERAAAGGDGGGGNDFECRAGLGYSVGKGELDVLFDAEGAGGEGVLGETALQDGVGVFVFLPEVADGGFALGEGGVEVVEVVALEPRADDEGRGLLGENVGEEPLGLAPGHAGEVAEGGAGGDEDGVHAVGLHELAGEVEAGLALVFGDGDDVFAAVGEGENGGGEGWLGAGGCFWSFFGRCRWGWGRFLGFECEGGRRGGGGQEEAATCNHKVNCRGKSSKQLTANS